jgi:hypothetical protein
MSEKTIQDAVDTAVEPTPEPTHQGWEGSEAKAVYEQLGQVPVFKVPGAVLDVIVKAQNIIATLHEAATAQGAQQRLIEKYSDLMIERLDAINANSNFPTAEEVGEEDQSRGELGAVCLALTKKLAYAKAYAAPPTQQEKIQILLSVILPNAQVETVDGAAADEAGAPDRTPEVKDVA